MEIGSAFHLKSVPKPLEKCEKIGLLAVNIEKVEFITLNGSTGSPLDCENE